MDHLAETLEKLFKEIERLKAREAELTAEINEIKARLGPLEGEGPKYDQIWFRGKMFYRFYITKLRGEGIPKHLRVGERAPPPTPRRWPTGLTS